MRDYDSWYPHSFEVMALMIQKRKIDVKVSLVKH